MTRSSRAADPKNTGKGLKTKKTASGYVLRANTRAKLKKELRLYQEHRRKLIRDIQKAEPGITEDELQRMNVIPSDLRMKDLEEYIKGPASLKKAYAWLESPLKPTKAKRKERNIASGIVTAYSRFGASDQEVRALEKALDGMSYAQMVAWRIRNRALFRDFWEQYDANKGIVPDLDDLFDTRTKILDSLGGAIGYSVVKDRYRKDIDPNSLTVRGKRIR